jgi:lysozyme family protein
MTFDEAFTKLLGHEGAYSNHKADPGGETMWGVTIAVARAHGYFGPMKDMPVNVAKEVYFLSYWSPCKCDQLPDAVRFPLFDAAVNSGNGQAIKWLQRAVGVKDDGLIGTVTLLAAKNQAGVTTAARMAGHRLQFMSSLPTWSAFGRGWCNRIAKNLLEAA